MKLVDLSPLIYSKMQVYPGDPKVEISLHDSYEEKGWELRTIKMGSHTGSHVDSFSHMHPGKESIDQLPLERFFGPALLVTKNGDWPEKTGLFFKEVVGLDEFLKIQAKNPSFVGGELSEDLERALLGAGIITYTDLVNLDQLPPGKLFTFYGLPLKIKEGDGSPVRAMAVFD